MESHGSLISEGLFKGSKGIVRKFGRLLQNSPIHLQVSLKIGLGRTLEEVWDDSVQSAQVMSNSL